MPKPAGHVSKSSLEESLQHPIGSLSLSESPHDSKQKIGSWNLFHVGFVVISEFLNRVFVRSDHINVRQR